MITIKTILSGKTTVVSLESYIKDTKLSMVFYVSALKHVSNDRAYIRAADNEGNTALHLAVQNGKELVAEILLDHYADVNGQKVLQYTKTCRHIIIIQNVSKYCEVFKDSRNIG